jgi:hypothetical protein
MNISAKSLRFDENNLWVELSDGRTLGVPLAWFPRLLRATAQQREDYEISPAGLHWDSLDGIFQSRACLRAGQIRHDRRKEPLEASALRGKRAAVRRSIWLAGNSASPCRRRCTSRPRFAARRSQRRRT